MHTSFHRCPTPVYRVNVGRPLSTLFTRFEALLLTKQRWIPLILSAMIPMWGDVFVERARLFSWAGRQINSSVFLGSVVLSIFLVVLTYTNVGGR